MRRLLKAFLLIVGPMLALIAIALEYSTMKGYTTWFVRVSGAVVSADGHPIKGWLHHRQDDNVFYFTRADSRKPVTYDLVFASSGTASVFGCGTWVAPPYLVVPVGDVNPPCFLNGGAGSKLAREQHLVSFVANDGVKLEARW